VSHCESRGNIFEVSFITMHRSGRWLTLKWNMLLKHDHHLVRMLVTNVSRKHNIVDNIFEDVSSHVCLCHMPARENTIARTLLGVKATSQTGWLLGRPYLRFYFVSPSKISCWVFQILDSIF